MSTALIIDITILVIMLIGVIWIVYSSRDSAGKFVLSQSSLEHLGLVIITPLVFILALDRALNAEAAATFFGAIAGYVFARVVKVEK